MTDRSGDDVTEKKAAARAAARATEIKVTLEEIDGAEELLQEIGKEYPIIEEVTRATRTFMEENNGALFIAHEVASFCVHYALASGEEADLVTDKMFELISQLAAYAIADERGYEPEDIHLGIEHMDRMKRLVSERLKQRAEEKGVNLDDGLSA